MSHAPHDGLFKLVFSDPEAAAGELRALLPPLLAQEIEWSTLTLEPGSLLGPELATRMADLLYSARLVSGNEVRLFFLFEHKSRGDRPTVLQVLGYAVRIWEGWAAQHGDAQPLPIVIPVVVSHDARGWTAPRSLRELFAVPAGPTGALLAPHLLGFELKIIDDLATVSDEALDARPLPGFAKLTLAALRDVRGANDLGAVLRRLRDRWMVALRPEDPRDRRAVEGLFRYIPMARPLDEPASIADAVRALDPTGEEKTMATIQQLMDASEARGEARGERRVLARLCARKFGPLSASFEARLAAASPADLERWAERVLDAATMEDVFRDG